MKVRMPEITSSLQYHTVEELLAMSIEGLAALVDQIPTDRQRVYKLQYDRWLRQQGVMTTVGSDSLEKEATLPLFGEHQQRALVPAGERAWANVASSTRERASHNEALPVVEAAPPARRVNLVILGAALVGVFICMLVMISILRGRANASTARITLTSTRTPTATPVNSPTPTPLALENQDRIIQGGNGGSSTSQAYPVTLKISLPDAAQPRVFVVQRRTVQTSQWDFDNNPDIASFVTGMAVRPIIGIPWSSENADYFQHIVQGAAFTLQMNTGADLHFNFPSSSQIARSPTSVLRQVGPGLVLILIGERDEAGNLTATRPMVLASYQPNGELLREGLLLDSLVGTPIPATVTLLPTPLDRVDIEIVSLVSQPTTKAVTVTLRIFNSPQRSIHFPSDPLC